MNSLRRLAIAILIVLIAAPAAGGVSAQTVRVGAAQTAQTTRTPADLCTEAVPQAQEPATRSYDSAEQVLQDGVDYWAVLCTEAGPIYADLYETESPLTVNNFVFLAQRGFYNNTSFHRVLPGFMAQGGDPTGTGSGGPGYAFADETSNGLVFDSIGLLAMANAGADTNGSQFFITYAQTSWLDGAHTIFGKVVQGIDVAELLTPRDPDQAPDYVGSTLYTVVIVDDPASVQVTLDGAPSVDHLQTLLEQDVVSQLNAQFIMDPSTSHTTDLAGEVEVWRGLGGDALASYMEGFLTEHGFLGAASIWLPLEACPTNAGDLPIWAVGFRVMDYGPDADTQAIVTDSARSDKLVETVAFESYDDPADIPARVFSKKLAASDSCGPNGTFYRLEMAYGRYVLVAELALDGDFISATTDPSSEQYLVYVLQDLLYNALGGTLDRGNDVAS